jgi:toxin YoeB
MALKGRVGPEPRSRLPHALSGFWSRRITDEHRMVYRVERDELQIAQLRFHY